MVPLACLLVLIPLVAGGAMDQNQMMQMMQQQMMQQMMQQQGGWGWNNQQQGGWNNQQQGGWNNQQQGGWNNQQQGGQQQGGQQQGGQNGDWWGMSNSDDYEAYLKWCEERKMAMQEQEQQQELLEMWQKREEERKMQAEREKHEREAKERHEVMQAQWKMWQARISQQHEFDDMTYKFAEMKHKYMFVVTTEFLKFCKCTDFSEDLERYMLHDGESYSSADDWDLDDLDAIEMTNAVDVARALANRPQTDQIKAFFGGLAMSMCEAGKAYVEQVREWEKQYSFLDKLM